jgi:hypothetical protein
MGTINVIRYVYRDYAGQARPANLFRNDLFPNPEENVVVTAGQMTEIDAIDPEDKVAAIAALQALHGGRQAQRRPTELISVDHFPEAGPNTHVIAIGGGLSNKLNRSLLHAAPFHPESQPTAPLYACIDFSSKQTVSRKFEGRTHTRPQWSIRDAREGQQIYPAVDQDGWLTRDYLLFSCLPYTSSRVHISAFGLYGPGVMALKMLVDGRGHALEEALAGRGATPYFQSLFAVEDIRHHHFSAGRKLRHLMTYPIQADAGH